MRLVRISAQNRDAVNAFIKERWFATDMVLHGEVIDMTAADGIVACDDSGEIAGLITYRDKPCGREVLSLDSVQSGKGVGSALMDAFEAQCVKLGCKSITLITTNDNLNALRFYQRRGYSMVRLYVGAVDESRKIKPDIPLIGDNGIPLRHELELELTLPRG